MNTGKPMSTEEWIAQIYRESDEHEKRCQEAAAKQRFGSPKFFSCLFGDIPDETQPEAQTPRAPAPREPRLLRDGLGEKTEAAVPAASPCAWAVRTDAHGRIIGKRESIGGRTHEYEFAYDERGRLTEVHRDGRLVEEYAYDEAGRRVMSRSEAFGMKRFGLEYDGERLRRHGDSRYFHGPNGARCAKRDARRGPTHYRYGPHGGLEWAKLPGNFEITWTRSPYGLPLDSFIGGETAERWHWRDLISLARYEDLRRGVTMDFHYTRGQRTPQAMTVTDGRGSQTFTLGYDQVGTLKAVADAHGILVQEFQYDSFGNLVDDTNIHTFVPIGFAGGVKDRWTGLIRFGHRDYDPETGRFTAPDPLGYTGGDHDLYEYCVDDPINAIDPEGLETNSTLPDSNAHQTGEDQGVAGFLRNIMRSVTGWLNDNSGPKPPLEPKVGSPRG